MADVPFSPSTDIRQPRDLWDKADILGKLLGSILIPLVIAVAGYYTSDALQERAAKQKTVDVAVTILGSKDVATPNLKARAEAVFAKLARESGTALPEQAKTELKASLLPSAPHAPLVVPASQPGKVVV